MKMVWPCGVMGVLLVCIGSLAAADTLKLKNGQVLQGKVLSQNESIVRFQVGNEITNYSTGEVRSVVLDGAAPAASAAPAAAPSAAPAAAVAPGTLTLPKGIELSVNFDKDVTSKQKPGSKFTTTLETNVMVDGQVGVAAGTKVYGVVADSRQQGLVGQSAIAIRLTGFNIAGNIVPITTEVLAGSGDRKAKQGARGAAAGAAIGAAAGGGGGAAKGAMIGAAASTLRRQTVGIPAGTIIEFHLAEPVTLNRS